MTKNSGANDPDKLIRTPDKLQKNRGLFKVGSISAVSRVRSFILPAPKPEK